MKKRLLALLLAVLCITTNIMLAVADEERTPAESEALEITEPAKTSDRTYILDFDFSDATMEEFTKNKQVVVNEYYGVADIIEYTDIDPESEKGKVLMLDYNGKSTEYHCFPKTIYSFGETINRGKLTYEIDAYITAAIALQMDMYQKGTVVTGGFFADSRTSAISLGANSSKVVPVNRWVNIQVVVDLDERMVSIYFDGEPSLENVSLPDTIQSFEGVDIWAFPSQNAMTVYISKLQCYVDMSKKVQDVEQETIYTKPEKMLKNLGIIQNLDKYSLTSEVSRGRLAQLMTRSMGVSDDEIDAYNGGEFADVGASNVYKRSIGYLTALDWVHSDNGYFYPDNIVTFGQAAKWMCYLAGYNTFAEKQGGYPFGYITILSELGITKGMELKYDTLLTEGDMFLMLSRLMMVDIYTPMTYGDEVILEKTKGHTVMAEYFNCREVKGVVTATGQTGLGTAQGAVSKTQLQIDSVTFNAQNITISDDLIGKSVNAYVLGDAEHTPNEIIYLEQSNKNEQLLIIDEDIVVVTDKNDSYEIEYLVENDKTEKVSVSKNAYYIYNGIAYGDVVPKSYLKPAAGEVIFTDNNKDGEYDVVMVNSYTYVAVKSVDTVAKKIYGQKDEVIALDNNSYVWDGQSEFDFKQLVEWNVIRVCRNLRGDLNILVLSERVKGIVDAVSDTEVVINEEAYPFAPVLTDAEKNTLKVGGTAYIYIDLRGRVCVINQDEKDMYETGYLIAVEPPEAFGATKVKMLMKTGDIEVYEVGKAFRYNGTKLSQIKRAPVIDESGYSVLDDAENISALSEYEKFVKLLTADAYKKQIALRTEEEIQNYLESGKILPNTVRQPVTFLSKTGNIITAMDTEYLQVDKAVNYSTAYRFEDHGRIIVNFSAIGDDVIGFIIPEDGAADTEYGVVDWTTRKDSDVYPEAYNMSASMVPEVLVLYEANLSTTVSTGAEALIVEKTYLTLNSEGEVVRGFDVYNRGKKVTYFTEEEAIGKEVETGDIIQVLRNNRGVVTAIRMLLKPSEKPAFITDSDYTKWVQLNYGILIAAEDGGLTIATQNDGTEEEPIPVGILPFTMPSDIKVFIFDLTKNKLYRGTISDVSNYTFEKNPDVRVATRTAGSRLEEVYIYYES